GAPTEESEVPVLDLEVGGRLHDVREELPLLEIEVAVVLVRRTRRSSVRDADERWIAAAGAHGDAVAHRRVQVRLDAVIERELQRICGRRAEHGQGDRQCERLCGRAESGTHGAFLLSVSFVLGGFACERGPGSFRGYCAVIATPRQ